MGAPGTLTGFFAKRELLYAGQPDVPALLQNDNGGRLRKSDTKGIIYIYGRQPSDTRKLEGKTFDVGNLYYGGHECLVVFDDVFVPWDRVFLCGEWQLAGYLAETFATYHRHSYCGCKPAISDLVLGAAALVGATLLLIAVWNRVLRRRVNRKTQELRDVRDHRLDLFNGMPSVLIVVDREGRLTRINTPALEMVAEPGAPALGRPFWEVFPFLEPYRDRCFQAIR